MSEMIYSPGLEGIIAGETAISTIDGGLRYRGYAIEDLADHACFEEVAYLILRGELPNSDELSAFRARLDEAAPLPDGLIAALRQIPESANMMDVMRTGASLLAHWDPQCGDNSTEANLAKAERLLAQLPGVLAAAWRVRHGQEPIAAVAGASLADNMLRMLGNASPSEASIKAVDVSYILYAEHEFNASAFTSRVVASTLSDLHSGVVAAIGALKGPLHGGANEKVMDVLREVGSADQAENWIRTALANKTKIMGFGHRVYKTGDPRAEYLKDRCRALAAESGSDELEQIADTIESIVRGEKGIPPNLDWPSARLYHYLGLEVELYTPLFVVSRVVGWSAHIIEQLENNRIIRPRSRYTGEALRAWPG